MLGINLLNLFRQSGEMLPLAEFGGQPIELFEYAALKQEQTARLALRETALYVNLAVLLSLLAARVQAVVVLDDKVMLMLPYLSGIMFWIYYNNDYYINGISAYIVKYLAPRLHRHILMRSGSDAGMRTVQAAIGSNHAEGEASDRKFVFAWEHIHSARSAGRRIRKAVNLLVLLLSYAVAPIIILVMAAQHSMQALELYEWLGGIAVTALVVLGITRIAV